MSISDRLDQISRQSVEADEQWDCGRSAFNADNYAPPIDVALANGDLMLAALRAVLDLCDKALAVKVSGSTEGDAAMAAFASATRRTIAAALGEES